MGHLVWLASYPKSGNTWFRVLLSNLTSEDDAPVGIDRLSTGAIASAREVFDEYVGVPSSDLTQDEIDALRPAVYRAIAAGPGDSYHKVHDALVRAGAGREPIIPVDDSSGAVYLVRNPLDVAVSYAHHAAVEPDRVIEWMNDPTHCFAGSRSRIEGQLRQRMLTWHGHVESWLDQDDVPVHLVRYEDLASDPHATFSGAARFLGLADDPDRIARAVSNSSFEGLQRQEQASGFAERPATTSSFFRRGVVGSWRSDLNDRQVALLIDHHGPMMTRLGYLDDDGTLLC
jgi:hypothetical protein